MNSFRVRVGDNWLKFYAGSKIKMLIKMAFFETTDEPVTRTFTTKVSADANQFVFGFGNRLDSRNQTIELPCEVYLKTSFLGKGILFVEAYSETEYNVRITVGKGTYLPILKKKLREFEYVSVTPFRTNKDVGTGLPLYPYVDWGFSFASGVPSSGPTVNTLVTITSNYLQQQIELKVPYTPPQSLHEHIDAIVAAINQESAKHCVWVYRIGNTIRGYDFASNDNGAELVFAPETFDWFTYFNDAVLLSFSHPGPGNAELQHYKNVVDNPSHFDYIFFPVHAANSSRLGYDFGSILNHWYPVAPYGPNPQNINYPGGFTGFTSAALTPFAYLKSVLNYIHSESGITTKDLFFDEELSGLVFFNPVIMSLINSFGGGIINRTFKYANLLPDITYAELMDSLKIMFGLIAEYNSRTDTITITTRKKVLQSEEFEDWTDLVVKEYSARRLPELISFEYSFPSDETAINRLANIVSRNVKPSVEGTGDLPALDANNDVRLVAENNLFYSYFKIFLTGGWNSLGEALNAFKTNGTTKTLNAKISTLFNALRADKYQPLGYSINWCIPYTEQEIENYDTQKKSVQPQLLFYRGLTTASVQTGASTYVNAQVPSGSYHNYDYAGNKTGNYSLAWNGPDGLVEQFQKEWLDMMASSSPVKFKATLTEQHLLNPRGLIKKQIGNQRYIVEEIEVSFTDDGFEIPTVTAWPVKIKYE